MFDEAAEAHQGNHKSRSMAHRSATSTQTKSFVSKLFKHTTKRLTLIKMR